MKTQPTMPYSEPHIRRAVERIGSVLGGADAAALSRIAHLFQDDEANLDACASAVSPELANDPAKRIKAFTNLRERINKKSAGTDIPLTFEADTRKRSAAHLRSCWIHGPILSLDMPTASAAKGRSSLPPELRDTPNPAINVTGSLMAKPHFGWAVVHASGKPDQAPADALIRSLDEHLSACGTAVFTHVKTDRSRAHILIPLLSPSFCRDAELVRFTDSCIGKESGRIVVPVRLREIDKTQHCGQVGTLQHFSPEGSPVAYASLTTAQKKEAFMLALYKGIVQDVVKALETGFAPELPVAIPEPSTDQHLDEFARKLNQFDARSTAANPATIAMGAAMPSDVAHAAPQGDARDLLIEWLENKNAPAFCAVLGEYGIGKTTCLRRFVHEVQLRHDRDPSYPQAIFIDLREYLEVPTDDAHHARLRASPQALESIIERAIHLNWREEGHPRLTAADVLRAVRTRRAVLIFDGLDERIVHMDNATAHAFIRELWRALPDAHPEAKAVRRGRLIISCRSHYFRTVTDQLGFFGGNFRESLRPESQETRPSGQREIRARDFRAILVLPFGEPEIRSYLGNVAGMDSERIDHTLEVFGRIHNLTELSKRPVLLSFLVQLMEQWQLDTGRPVQAANLYAEIVRQWLARDHPKHRVKPDHKVEIMEHFAARLWRAGKKEWSIAEAEAWLTQVLDGCLRHVRMRLEKDQVKEEIAEHDFRTATFIVSTGKDRFRFAHTSFQEYFLAAHLVHALDGDLPSAIAAWDLPLPSRETLEFLGQILAEEPDKLEARTFVMEDILGSAGTGSYIPATTRRPAQVPHGHLARLAVFNYWLLARELALPDLEPQHVNLEHAELEDVELTALPLAGANLRHTRLSRARLDNTDLRRSDLTGAELRQVICLDSLLDDAVLESADLAGFQSQGGSIRDLRATTAYGNCEWSRMDSRGAVIPISGVLGVLTLDSEILRTLLHSSLGHTGWVSACAWSPNGQKILSGSVDHSLKVWDAASGRCLLTLRDHLHSVNACGWSPDGRRIVSGSGDATLKIWDSATGRCLRTMRGHEGSVSACGWSPDGQKILSGSSDHTLKIWSATTGRCLLTLRGHTGWTAACAWSPDGQRVLSASVDTSLKVWDVSSGRCLLTMQGHGDTVTACSWSPDGQRILSGSGDATLKVWDATTGRCLLELKSHTARVSGCAWSHNGEQLLSSAVDNTLKIWDAASGRCLVTLEGHKERVLACAWSPNDQKVLSGAGDRCLKIWDAASGRCQLTVQGLNLGRAVCGAWSPEGNRLLSVSGENSLKVWDAASGQALLEVRGIKGRVSACAWSPNGQNLLFAPGDSTLKVWDATSGRCLLTMQDQWEGADACMWSPDGRSILSSSGGALKVWDAASGRCLHTLKGHNGSISSCGWSPDSQKVLSGSSDHTLKVWDVASGRCLLTLQGHRESVFSCAWSPNGQKILSGSSDHTLKVWDAVIGRCLMTLQGHKGSVASCAWNPDGNKLLSGSGDNTTKVWDSTSGHCLLTLQGHKGSVSSCAWNPDGQRILSCSWDNTMKVWEANTGECLWTNHLLPEDQHACILGPHGPGSLASEVRFKSLSREAFRFLFWGGPEHPCGLPLAHALRMAEE